MTPLAALLVFAAAAATVIVATAAALQQHELLENISAAEDSSLAVPPHGCVEAGSPYSEGSPLPSNTKCERCFCLGGRRRCVRPRCLAPPAACIAEPAPGACCPERYRCQHHINATTPAASHGTGDCVVDGNHVAEGESVTREKCSHCYCLRGEVHCQPIACARPLLDCRPLLRAGDCCPYSYNCPLRGRTTQRALTSRSRALNTGPIALTTRPITTARSNNDVNPAHNNATDPPVHDTHGTYSTIQPDGSVRIIVNGTVNCTAELASGTAPPYNGDIITEANYHDGESFVVNVTSSLRTNSSHSPSRPAAPPTAAAARPTRNDFDYDYNEATLPPSLPNLKIIPFVAADAVVERESRPSVADRRRDDIAPVYVSAPAPAPAPAPPRTPPIIRPVTTSPPVIGLFSPPAHIEGGFVPKGVGFGSEDAISAMGQPQPATPTQDPIGSLSCTTADGEIIHNGVSVTVMCEECSCQRGRLRCAGRPCRSQPGCRRRPPPKLTLMLTNTSLDTYCCGELVCETEGANTTTKQPENKPTSGITQPARLANRTEAVHATTTLAPTTTVSTTTSTTSSTTSVATTTETGTSQTRKATSPTTTSVTKVVTSTSPRYDVPETNHTSTDYSEEDEDEGFSFGNVLKLLLSDSYGTTGPTVSTTRTTPFIPRSTPVTTHTPVAEPLIPISNRIDHLMLGEATSIRKTTPRPSTLFPIRPPPAPAPVPAPVAEVPAAVTGGGLLPKLAGCNIYGRMYRVGRIIAELSSACAECRCTELGVQCRALHC